MNGAPGGRLTIMAKKFALFLGGVVGVLQFSVAAAHGQMPSMQTSQNPAAKAVVEEFDAATIKPDTVGRSYSLNISPGGRVQIENWTLRTLIRAAYNNPLQIQGGAAWMDEDHYDVEAKPPNPSDGSPAYNVHHDNWSLEDPKLRTMLQALLKERFQLKVHLAVKDGPVYVLERSDGELALTPTKNPGSSGGHGGIGFAHGVGLLNTTMPQFTAFLGGAIFHETVIDETGLEGSYDFRSKTSLTDEELQNLDADSIQNLFLRAVKEMGLKLKKSTGPVMTLVIDSAAQPSAN
jgi:uncharacterized protein (TIGR03435 family)